MSDTSRSSTPSPAESRQLFSNRRRRSTVDYGDATPDEAQINALYSMDVFRWKDDDICRFLK